MSFRLIWFDSLGAKSSSVMIEACGEVVVIDPGVAIMHRGFPASSELKKLWYERGLGEVIEALERAGVVVITHYHHDHYLYKPEHLSLYKGKLLLVKNPNIYINLSQRSRAEEFLRRLYELSSDGSFEDILREPITIKAEATQGIKLALDKSFGSYDARRRELIEEGLKWFEGIRRRWGKWPWINEFSNKTIKVSFADGREYDIGCMRLRFTEPLYHGVEFSRLGWVLGVLVETANLRLYYSSDVNGPIIEDYAYYIVDVNPDVLVLDGPPTYLLGYTLNRVNLERAVGNAVYIIENTSKLRLVVYDHHLTREPRFRERTKRVWERARKLGVTIATAAELLGGKPVVEEVKA